MKWNIDPSHTSLELAVRHMGLSTVRGRFKKMTGTVEASDDGVLKAIKATIDAASIDTGESKRDEHLRSSDFLDVEKYPSLMFRSTKIDPRSDGRYKIKGELAIRGETRPVTFEVEATKPVKHPWGNLRAGATANGKLNRKDWDLTWNMVLELGALLVGEEVRFTLDVEVVAPAAVAA